MEKYKIIEELADKKAMQNNSIDLNAYAWGLDDMYEHLVKTGRIIEPVQKPDSTEVWNDIYNHLSLIENYMKGEHNHETDEIQQKEDWDIYTETRRLKEELLKIKNEK